MLPVVLFSLLILLPILVSPFSMLKLRLSGIEEQVQVNPRGRNGPFLSLKNETNWSSRMDDDFQLGSITNLNSDRCRVNGRVNGRVESGYILWDMRGNIYLYKRVGQLNCAEMRSKRQINSQSSAETANFQIKAYDSNVTVSQLINITSGQSRVDVNERFMGISFYSNRSNVQIEPNGNSVNMSFVHVFTHVTVGSEHQSPDIDLISDRSTVFVMTNRSGDERTYLMVTSKNSNLSLQYDKVRFQARNAVECHLELNTWLATNVRERLTILSNSTHSSQQLAVLLITKLAHIQIGLTEALIRIEYGETTMEISADSNTIIISTRTHTFTLSTFLSPFSVVIFKDEQNVDIRVQRDGVVLSILTQTGDILGSMDHLSMMQIRPDSNTILQIDNPDGQSTDLNRLANVQVDVTSRSLSIKTVLNTNSILVESNRSNVLIKSNATKVGLTAKHVLINIIAGRPRILITTGNTTIQIDAEIRTAGPAILPNYTTPGNIFTDIGPFYTNVAETNSVKRTSIFPTEKTSESTEKASESTENTIESTEKTSASAPIEIITTSLNTTTATARITTATTKKTTIPTKESTANTQRTTVSTKNIIIESATFTTSTGEDETETINGNVWSTTDSFIIGQFDSAKIPDDLSTTTISGDTNRTELLATLVAIQPSDENSSFIFSDPLTFFPTSTFLSAITLSPSAFRRLADPPPPIDYLLAVGIKVDPDMNTGSNEFFGQLHDGLRNAYTEGRRVQLGVSKMRSRRKRALEPIEIVLTSMERREPRQFTARFAVKSDGHFVVAKNAVDTFNHLTNSHLSSLIQHPVIESIQPVAIDPKNSSSSQIFVLIVVLAFICFTLLILVIILVFCYRDKNKRTTLAKDILGVCPQGVSKKASSAVTSIASFHSSTECHPRPMYEEDPHVFHNRSPSIYSAMSGDSSARSAIEYSTINRQTAHGKLLRHLTVDDRIQSPGTSVEVRHPVRIVHPTSIPISNPEGWIPEENGLSKISKNGFRMGKNDYRDMAQELLDNAFPLSNIDIERFIESKQ